MIYQEAPIHSMYRGFKIRYYDTDGFSAWRWIGFGPDGLQIAADTLADLKWKIKNSVVYA